MKNEHIDKIIHDSITQLDASKHSSFDKKAAWETLHQRLSHSPKQNTYWLYSGWAAAAILLIVIVIIHFQQTQNINLVISESRQAIPVNTRKEINKKQKTGSDVMAKIIEKKTLSKHQTTNNIKQSNHTIATDVLPIAKKETIDTNKQTEIAKVTTSSPIKKGTDKEIKTVQINDIVNDFAPPLRPHKRSSFLKAIGQGKCNNDVASNITPIHHQNGHSFFNLSLHSVN